MDFRLGQSGGLTDYSPEQVSRAELAFWKLGVEGISSALTAFGYSILPSLLFQRKLRFIGYCTGLGFGYSLARNLPDSVTNVSFF
jgi:hypothetical protein